MVLQEVFQREVQNMDIETNTCPEIWREQNIVSLGICVNLHEGMPTRLETNVLY